MQQFWQKLQNKEWYQRMCVRMPDDLRSQFDDHDETTLVQEAIYIHEITATDACIVFLRDKEEFLTYVKWFDVLLKDIPVFRIAYPKQAGNTSSDLNRDTLRHLMLQLWRDAVRQIALNESRSAMRFKYLKK